MKVLFLCTSYIFLLIILSGHSPYPLANVIAGEASTCPTEAKIALAYIYTRNTQFNGWGNASPSDYLIATTFYKYQDYSNGGFFWFDQDDLLLDTVSPYIEGKTPTATFTCIARTIYVYP